MALKLEIPIHAGNIATPVVTETATITAPAADAFAVYHDLSGTDLLREGEIYRGWEMLYRGWKSFAYDPFPASMSIPDYFAVPLDSPIIASRIITTDIGLIVAGMVGFGIGGNIVDRKDRTLLARVAFQDLKYFYTQRLAA